MARPRSASGTIPSMEASHEELKDNTIIIGTRVLIPVYARALTRRPPVAGASGDLAKKKVRDRRR